MAEAWAPALDDVARHIPTRTRDTKTPGSDALLGTFTASTTPDNAAAQAVIDGAVQFILSETGPLDETEAGLLTAARAAAEWRAAADIELAYPNRDADVAVYAELDQRAKDSMAQLVHLLEALGEGFVEQVPFWSAPNPPVYADKDPGDYTLPLAIYFGGIDQGPL
jgi:hypothetical protein